MITDPINGTFQDKFLVGNRIKDLILLEPTASEWGKAENDFVFANWKKDSQ